MWLTEVTEGKGFPTHSPQPVTAVQKGSQAAPGYSILRPLQQSLKGIHVSVNCRLWDLEDPGNRVHYTRNRRGAFLSTEVPHVAKSDPTLCTGTPGKAGQVLGKDSFSRQGFCVTRALCPGITGRNCHAHSFTDGF